MKAKEIPQHQPLRIPQGWNTQETQFVIQLERLIEDLYREIGLLKERVKKLEEE